MQKTETGIGKSQGTIDDFYKKQKNANINKKTAIDPNTLSSNWKVTV